MRNTIVETVRNIFDAEPVNRGRQTELDIAKGFAIIFMVGVHVLEELGPELTGIMPLIVGHYLSGMPAAPVFMFCMGIGIVYSRNQSAIAMIRRGVRIFLTGIALNFVRSGLGAFIVWLSRNSVSEYLRHGQAFFEVDILAFAGLALICIGLMRMRNLSNAAMLCIAIGCSIIGTFVRNVPIDNAAVSQAAGYFVGTNDMETCFPLLNWLIFPVAGYVFGTYYIRCRDKKKFFRFDIPMVLLGNIYLTILALGLYEPASGYYYMSIGEAVIVLLFVYGALGVYYRVSRFLPQPIIKALSTMSSSVNEIYCIHWVILKGASAFILYVLAERFIPNMGIILVIAFAILFVSFWLAQCYRGIKNRVRQ